MDARMWRFSDWIEEVEPLVLKNKLQNQLERAGFKVLDFVEFHFSPHGWTALWLLGESHLAVHTFPEKKTSYIELSSCVKKNFDNFIELNFTN